MKKENNALQREIVMLKNRVHDMNETLRKMQLKKNAFKEDAQHLKREKAKLKDELDGIIEKKDAESTNIKKQLFRECSNLALEQEEQSELITELNKKNDESEEYIKHLEK
eukprot:UN29925